MAVGAVAVRRVRHAALVSRRARRPVRHRRRPGAAADRVESVHQHPRPDRKRRAAHRHHGHLQQDRRRARAARARRAGAARRRRHRRRRSRRADAASRRRCSTHSPRKIHALPGRWPACSRCWRSGSCARRCRRSRRRGATANAAMRPARDGSIFQFPHLWLGVLCIFVYVGVEVMAGDAIGTYGRGFGMPLDETKFFTSFTLRAMLVGYVVGLVTIPRIVSQQRYLALRRCSACCSRRRLPHQRLCLGRLRRRAGVRQRDDVAGDFPAGDPGPGPADRDAARRC